MKSDATKKDVIVGGIDLSKSISPEMKEFHEIKSMLKSLDQKSEKRFEVFEKRIDEMKLLLQDITSKVDALNGSTTGDEPEKSPT